MIGFWWVFYYWASCLWFEVRNLPRRNTYSGNQLLSSRENTHDFVNILILLVSSAKFVGLFYVGVKLEYLNIDTTIFNLILFLDGLKINALYINQVCRLCYFSHLLKMLFLEVCLLIFIETLFFFSFIFKLFFITVNILNL